MSTSKFPEDRVYVRDEHFQWVPAVVLETETDRALVRIDLPQDWRKTTIATGKDCRTQRESINNEKRWIPLKDYYNHRLPLQNDAVCRDMAELKHLHEAAILYQIKERHCSQNRPYTRVGEIIVAMNPCQWIHGLYSAEKQQFYVDNFANNKASPSCTSLSSSAIIERSDIARITNTAYVTHSVHGASEEKKDDEALVSTSSLLFGTSEYDRLGCEPHVYEVSSLAFKGLSQDRKDQTILVSGESGAGKTETVKIVLKHLATLRQGVPSTNALKHEDELVHHLIASSPIFEAFGNAKTLRNNNSSRFGKVTKLNYSLSPSGTCLIGSSFDTYLLETSRTVAHVEGERNFHIFYQMLAAPSEVKSELLGPDWCEATASDFHYMNNAGNYNPRNNDAILWEQTATALKAFGWEGGSLARLMHALGNILLIGNIMFDEKVESEASIANQADLNLLADSLGVPVETLQLALTQRMIETAQEKLCVPHTQDQAKEARDALAKAIYAGIFSSIVRQINILTSAPPAVTGKHKAISLVDIFGFESFEVNRFEQLCINYANERLQQKYVLHTLRRHKVEYEAEGIELPNWKNIDNSCTVDLFEGASGVINTLNEQCIRPSGNSEVFVFKVKQLNKNHQSLIQGKLQLRTEFGVQHFAGGVTYDASKFVERNTDKLPDLLISVVAKSTNGLIAQELGELMSCAGTIPKNKRKSWTVIEKFRAQLKMLLTSIDNSQTRYIRCIKPCEEIGTTKRIDHQTVLRQLKCAGLVTAIELSRETFPDKLPFYSVEQRFTCLMPPDMLLCIKDMMLHDKAQLMMSILFAPLIERYRDSEFAMPFACGHTKVYFRAGALGTLESMRQELFAVAAMRVQQTARRVAGELKYVNARNGAIQLQALYRCKVVYAAFKRKKRSSTKIQAATRGIIQAARFWHAKSAATTIQRRCHANIARQKFRKMKQAATVLTAWKRMYRDRARFQKTTSAVSKLQAAVRSQRQQNCFKERKCSAVVISGWWKAVAARRTYLREQNAAFSLTRWSRSRVSRIKHCRQQQENLARKRRREAGTVLSIWCKARFDRIRFVRMKDSATCIATCERARNGRRVFMKRLAHRHSAAVKLQSFARSRQQKKWYIEMTAAVKLQSFVRSRLQQTRHITEMRSSITAAKPEETVRQKEESSIPNTGDEKKRNEISSDKEIRVTEAADCVLVPKEVLREVEYYKKQVADLNHDIIHVTSESALHAEEVEAEFEERLAEYEEEVLVLKQTIECCEIDKINLKDEIVANAENVRNLKTGIHSMQNSHRDYLSKVMRAIEKANSEHANALAAIKRERDDKVAELEVEIERLKAERKKDRGMSDEKKEKDITRLARKLEKLIAPDYITAMVEKSNLQTKPMVDFVEEKVSSKARKIIYRLEDLARLGGNAEAEKGVQGLQQQLVNAYEEIERLQEEVRQANGGGAVRVKRGPRKMFGR